MILSWFVHLLVLSAVVIRIAPQLHHLRPEPLPSILVGTASRPCACVHVVHSFPHRSNSSLQLLKILKRRPPAFVHFLLYGVPEVVIKQITIRGFWRPFIFRHEFSPAQLFQLLLAYIGGVARCSVLHENVVILRIQLATFGKQVMLEMTRVVRSGHFRLLWVNEERLRHSIVRSATRHHELQRLLVSLVMETSDQHGTHAQGRDAVPTKIEGSGSGRRWCNWGAIRITLLITLTRVHVRIMFKKLVYQNKRHCY